MTVIIILSAQKMCSCIDNPLHMHSGGDCSTCQHYLHVTTITPPCRCSSVSTIISKFPKGDYDLLKSSTLVTTDYQFIATGHPVNAFTVLGC